MIYCTAEMLWRKYFIIYRKGSSQTIPFISFIHLPLPSTDDNNTVGEERRDVLGPRHHPRRPIRQLAPWRSRLESLTKPLLGNSDSGKKQCHAIFQQDCSSKYKDVDLTLFLITQVWASEDLEEMVCIGSIAELEALSGTKVADLHRETVDKLTIPSKRPGTA